MRYAQFVRNHLDVRQEGGTEFLVICPWHGDTNPSMYVNVETGLWLCHSCEAKGNIDRLATRLGTVVQDTAPPPSRLRERIRSVRDVFVTDEVDGHPDEWLQQFAFDHPYWEERGFSPETIQRFGLGYDLRRDMVTIPLRDSMGRVQGVIRRRLNDERPKYLYPGGFAIGKHLFSSWLVRKSNRKKVALVEGSLDAVACWDARVPALAMLGARLTSDQRTLLTSLGVQTAVVFTDNDRPGRDAVEGVRDALKGTGVVVRVAVYRDYWSAKDPADLQPHQRRKAFHSALRYAEWKEVA